MRKKFMCWGLSVLLAFMPVSNVFAADADESVQQMTSAANTAVALEDTGESDDSDVVLETVDDAEIADLEEKITSSDEDSGDSADTVSEDAAETEETDQNEGNADDDTATEDSEVSDSDDDVTAEANDDAAEAATETESEPSDNAGESEADASADASGSDETIETEESLEVDSDLSEELTASVADEDVAGAVITGGSSTSDAVSISIGTKYTGTLSSSNTSDYFKFKLSTSGTVTIVAAAYFKTLNLTIYESDGDKVWSDSTDWNSTTEMSNVSTTSVLTSGTYYLAATSDSGYGSYNFKLTFASAGETFKESQGGSDNSISTAHSISLNKTYTGQIAENDEYDYYKFTISTSGNVSFKFTTNFYIMYYTIYDANGDEVCWTTMYEGTATDDADLTSGTYYLCAEKFYQSLFSRTYLWSGTSGKNLYGSYSFKVTFTSAGESFKETQGGNNNSVSAADSISVNTTYKGQIAYNDTRDFYKFKVSKTSTITVSSTASISKLAYYIYDSNGFEKWSNTYSEDSSSGTISVSENVKLSAGTYYLAVIQSSGYGNYSFKIKFGISTVKLSSTSYTYNGRQRSPSVTVKTIDGTTLRKGTHYTVSYSSSSRKLIGTYKVTVKGKGIYAGVTITKTFKIIPKQASIRSLKSSKKKQLTVKWSKISGSTSGNKVKYQIYYRVKGSSTWKKITTTSTSKTIKSLKSGKTYQVKVRAYKKVSGTTYYGSWSKVKTVKVK